MENRKNFQEFTNVYPFAKTLRFELKPIGETNEHIKKKGFITEDTVRAEDYEKAKKIIDKYHIRFIGEVLSEYKIPKEDLEKYTGFYNEVSANSEKFKTLKKAMRESISKAFEKHEKWKNLFKKELITKDLEYFGSEKEQAVIFKFRRFTTYFTGFHENRKNMYTGEDKATGIANRLIEENLPIFLNNLRIFEKIKVTLKDELNHISKDLPLPRGVANLDNLFSPDSYNALLTQKGITAYNTIIGGKTPNKGKKIKGINEHINLYNQKQKTKDSRFPEMKELRKQILAPVETPSFIPEAFQNDREVFETILEVYDKFKKNVLPKDGTSLRKLLTTLNEYDLNGVFIPNKEIHNLSGRLLGHREVLPNAIIRFEQDKKKVTKGRSKKMITWEEYEKKHPYFSIEFLNTAAEKIINERIADLDIKNESGLQSLIKHELTRERKEGKEGNFCDEAINAFEKGITVSIQNKTKEFPAIVKLSESYKQTTEEQEKKELIEDTEAATAIKKAMDYLKSVQFFCNNLRLKNDVAEQDNLFYSEFSKYDTLFRELNLVYDKVRNYLTRKPYSLDKVKLNFNNSTLLNGWDVNKETDNSGVILRKDGNYYLGINPGRENIFEKEFIPKQNENVWEKMNYKLLPGPNKMLPKVFFAKNNKAFFNPSENIMEIYNEGHHKKGETFNIDDCHTLIDFFKASIAKHEDWKHFGFKFSETKKYNDISDFYKEVADQGYKITFSNIPDSSIKELVEEGKLYLFQIYNKDFSEHSKGTPNLHTLYWKMLFNENNLKDVVYKLNGEAEMFHRKASLSIDKTTIHKANKPIELRNPTEEKKENTFTYDIIKDRRFTKDKYFFHVPITINFKASTSNQYEINNKVDEFIKQEFDSMHIIGIDRGERHLLYISVIDTKGKIKQQFTLNTLESHGHKQDFRQKLAKREEDRIQARKNWQAMEGIKNLKTGYLSLVVHKIANLILEHKAIVVMEDLNTEFKNNRKRIEKSVYQKFENMLISKLNFLASKDQTRSNAPGGLLHGYQLTPLPDKVSDIKMRWGFIFYVSAWNTSQIDPATGFVNLFNTKYSNREDAVAFFEKFKDITYDKKNNLFSFEMENYADFSKKAEGTRQNWVLYSYGKRIEQKKNDKGYWVCETIDLTEALKKLFEEFEIDINKNLKAQILKQEKAEFFKQLLWLFQLMVQMRNSEPQSSAKEGQVPLDYMISPVKDTNGQFYYSEDYHGKEAKLPVDADANGAYNIARKGLMLLQRIKEQDVPKLAISNKEWLTFVQEQNK